VTDQWHRSPNKNPPFSGLARGGLLRARLGLLTPARCFFFFFLFVITQHENPPPSEYYSLPLTDPWLSLCRDSPCLLFPLPSSHTPQWPSACEVAISSPPPHPFTPSSPFSLIFPPTSTPPPSPPLFSPPHLLPPISPPPGRFFTRVHFTSFSFEHFQDHIPPPPPTGAPPPPRRAHVDGFFCPHLQICSNGIPSPIFFVLEHPPTFSSQHSGRVFISCASCRHASLVPPFPQLARPPFLQGLPIGPVFNRLLPTCIFLDIKSSVPARMPPHVPWRVPVLIFKFSTFYRSTLPLDLSFPRIAPGRTVPYFLHPWLVASAPPPPHWATKTIFIGLARTHLFFFFCSSPRELADGTHPPQTPNPNDFPSKTFSSCFNYVGGFVRHSSSDHVRFPFWPDSPCTPVGFGAPTLDFFCSSCTYWRLSQRGLVFSRHSHTRPHDMPSFPLLERKLLVIPF